MTQSQSQPQNHSHLEEYSTHVGQKNNIFLPMEAKIVRVSKATETEMHFTLRMVEGQNFTFEPGQILEVSLFGYGEIPIGLASSPTRAHTFDIVIRSVGRVSQAINRLKEGDSLYVRGPLGKGFPLEKLRNHPVLIVAGGIGLCPTRSLVQYILDRRSEFGKFTLFYGAKSPDHRMFLGDLAFMAQSPDVDLFQIVDKGSPSWQGRVGVITQLFKETTLSPDTRVVICGPPVMFKFVIAELDKIGIARSNVYVDLERRMKCGVGKCGHCQINDKYCCVDGPVFAFDEIQHLEEAL